MQPAVSLFVGHCYRATHGVLLFFEKDVPVCLCLLASVRVQMEQLVLEGEGLASSTVLLNASSQMERKITHRDAQAFLKSLVKDKWLSEVVKELCAQNVFCRQVYSECYVCSLPAVTGGIWGWTSLHSGAATVPERDFRGGRNSQLPHLQGACHQGEWLP